MRSSLIALALNAAAPALQAAVLVSDGSDGAFAPGPGSHVIDLSLPGREGGVLNFTTIDIPLGTTVSFKINALNTPVHLLAQSDVSILGTIVVSASGGHAGPGGGEGGLGGFGDAACGAAECRPATAGGGILGGNAGPNATPGGIKSTPGFAGSGGGMASAGLAADPTRFSASAPATSVLSALPLPLVGGSGGGGGGGWMFFGVELGGGNGGDGGGAIRIATAGALTLGGTVLANGSNGSWGFTNVGGTGGPGGGGSGGNVQLVADTIDVLDSAIVHALGGWGGCLGTEPCDLDRARYSKLNNGGIGFFDLSGRVVTLSASADIQAVAQVHVVPLPASLPLMAGALAWLGARRKRSRGSASIPVG